MKPKSSKTWDMKIHWLHEKYIPKQIRLYYCKGDNNDAEFFNKKTPPIINRQQQPSYVHYVHIMK